MLPLRNNAFQVTSADFPEQVDTAALDVVHVEQPRIPTRDDPPENALALDQWQMAQIAAVEIRHVEGVEIRLVAAVEESIKLRPAVSIEAEDFAIQDCLVRELDERCAKTGERFVDVRLAGH